MLSIQSKSDDGYINCETAVGLLFSAGGGGVGPGLSSSPPLLQDAAIHNTAKDKYKVIAFFIIIIFL